jgi:hypothetical protein
MFALLLAQVLEVELDTAEAPDLAEWGAKAKALAVEWTPKIAAALEVEAPAKVSLIFRAQQDAPGATAGRRVYLSAPYVRKRPDDWAWSSTSSATWCRPIRSTSRAG